MRRLAAAAAAATARWQWAAMKGAPLTGACSCEVGVREAAASVLGPSMSLGRGAPACQRRQSVRTARCWELAHLGALDDGSATHLLRHTGGRASARRAARTHPTAPIPQDRLRHAFGPARAAGAADLESAIEARTAQRQPSGTDGCMSSDTCIHLPVVDAAMARKSRGTHFFVGQCLQTSATNAWRGRGPISSNGF